MSLRTWRNATNLTLALATVLLVVVGVLQYFNGRQTSQLFKQATQEFRDIANSAQARDEERTKSQKDLVARMESVLSDTKKVLEAESDRARDQGDRAEALMKDLSNLFDQAKAAFSEQVNLLQQEGIRADLREFHDALDKAKEIYGCQDCQNNCGPDYLIRLPLGTAQRLEKQLDNHAAHYLAAADYVVLAVLGGTVYTTSDLADYCRKAIQYSKDPVDKHVSHLMLAHTLFTQYRLGNQRSDETLRSARDECQKAIDAISQQDNTDRTKYFLGRAYMWWAHHELLNGQDDIGMQKERAAKKWWSELPLRDRLLEELKRVRTAVQYGTPPYIPCPTWLTQPPSHFYQTPTPAPLPDDSHGVPVPHPVPAESEGKLVILNRTYQPHELCINGLYYIILPGRKEITVPLKPVEAYLPEREAPKTWGLEHWKSKDDHKEMILVIGYKHKHVDAFKVEDILRFTANPSEPALSEQSL